jgi:hypothetical protein
MRIGIELYRHMLTRESCEFARHAECTNLMQHNLRKVSFGFSQDSKQA